MSASITSLSPRAHETQSTNDSKQEQNSDFLKTLEKVFEIGLVIVVPACSIVADLTTVSAVSAGTLGAGAAVGGGMLANIQAIAAWALAALL